MTLQRLDDVSEKIDEFIHRAQRMGFGFSEVVDQVARSRNLTFDHAHGVVKRRWDWTLHTDTGREGIGSSRGIVRKYNPAVGCWTPFHPDPDEVDPYHRL